MTLTDAQRWVKRLVLLLLFAAVVAGFAWWRFTHWAPARAQYPIQGVAVDAEDGALKWPTLATLGADFAYVRASSGGDQRDARFAANADGARAAGVALGALHEFSLCAEAGDQAAVFVTTVDRNAVSLPPAVALDFAPGCNRRPPRALVLSELNTFLNQIERHFGAPALLRISPAFETRYRISEGLARKVWLVGDWLEPDYAAKPWEIWQANSQYRIQGAPGSVRWNVARPAGKEAA